jgi:hypothetical protein
MAVQRRRVYEPLVGKLGGNQGFSGLKSPSGIDSGS